MFNFEKLEVWQKSVSFAGLVYELTKKFPNEERFGLTNQMRRAAISISSNIAEGCSRSSATDFRRFVEVATGSVFEVVSQARLGLTQGWLTEESHAQIYAAALEIVRMLSGLRSSLKG
ncbi:MAG TPA: four helix bundle protein [Opitutaceae bacterium]|nr:four helix bundle protein [Opitutaceae bacterium]